MGQETDDYILGDVLDSRRTLAFELQRMLSNLVLLSCAMCVKLSCVEKLCAVRVLYLCCVCVRLCIQIDR